MAYATRRPGSAQNITASAGPIDQGQLTEEEKKRRRQQGGGGQAPGQQAPWGTPNQTASTTSGGGPSRNPFSGSVYARPAQTMQGPTVASFSARPQGPPQDANNPFMAQLMHIAGSTPTSPGGQTGGMFMPSGVPGGGQDQNPWHRFMQTIALGGAPPSAGGGGGAIPLGGPGPGGSGPMQGIPVPRTPMPAAPGLGNIPLAPPGGGGGQRPAVPGMPPGGLGSILGAIMNPQGPRPPQQGPRPPQQQPQAPPPPQNTGVTGGQMGGAQQAPMPPPSVFLPPQQQAPQQPPSFALPGGGIDQQAQTNWYAQHAGQAAPGGGTYNNTPSAPAMPPGMGPGVPGYSYYYNQGYR